VAVAPSEPSAPSLQVPLLVNLRQVSAQPRTPWVEGFQADFTLQRNGDNEEFRCGEELFSARWHGEERVDLLGREDDRAEVTGERALRNQTKDLV
jgi:hypothetical protein